MVQVSRVRYTLVHDGKRIALQQEANSRREAVRAVSVAMQNSNLPPALCDALKALADS